MGQPFHCYRWAPYPHPCANVQAGSKVSVYGVMLETTRFANHRTKDPGAVTVVTIRSNMENRLI